MSGTAPTSLLAIRSAIRALRTAAAAVRAVHVAGALVVAGLPGVLLRPDLWMVERVVFSGVERADEAALRHLADLPNGTRLWSVFPPSLARRVARHPWVDEASVAVHWDGTVVVDVVEHEPVAVVHHDGAWLVDAAGEPFAPASVDEADLPHVTGVEAELATQHPALPRVALRAALDLLAALEARGIVHKADVSEVAFSRTAGFRVVLRNTTLRLGLEHHDRALDRLGVLLAREPDLLGRAVDVDLSPSRVALIRPRQRTPNL